LTKPVATAAGMSTYTLSCPVPRGQGLWYLTILNANGHLFNASVEITATMCDTGKGGWNCGFSSLPLNTSNPAAGVIPVETINITAAGTPYHTMFLQYFFLDTQANTTNMYTFNASVAGTPKGNVFIYLQYAGYPDFYWFLAQEALTKNALFTLFPEDTVDGGRIYFAVGTTSPPLSFTMSAIQGTIPVLNLNNVTTPSNGTAITVPGLTGGNNTNGETGGNTNNTMTPTTPMTNNPSGTNENNSTQGTHTIGANPSGHEVLSDASHSAAAAVTVALLFCATLFTSSR